MQALSVIHLWEQDPPEVVLDWLMTGDEGLRKEAAGAALVGFYAAYATAYATAYAAGAAEAAYTAAAYTADARAARAAVLAAARAAARDEFEALVNECFEGVL